MRSLYTIILLIFLPLLTTGQNILLPVWVVDSLIYESKVSRQCNEVVKAQTIELEKQGLELIHTNTALKLSQSQNGALTSLIGNSEKERELDKRQYALDKSKMKQKIKKRNGLILIEGFAILGLLLLL